MNIPENLKNGNEAIEIIRKEIMDFTYKDKLKKIPEDSLFLPHNKYTKIKMPCKKYFIDILLVVMGEISEDRIEEISNHIITCPKCFESQQSIQDAHNYRKGQLQNNKVNWYKCAPHDKIDNRTQNAIVKDIKQKYEKVAQKGLEKMLNSNEIQMDYEIAVGCICGNINKYAFNHLRFKEIFFGRKSDEGCSAHINVCSDDGTHLSSKQCYFKYDEDKKDWYICTTNKKGKNIYYITKKAMEQLKITRPLEDKKLKCQSILKDSFTPLKREYPDSEEDKETKKVYFSDISLICLMSTSKKELVFKKEKKEGVFHPVLGKLPFGWYIDIISKRNPFDIEKSYREKSARHNTTTRSVKNSPQKTIVEK